MRVLFVERQIDYEPQGIMQLSSVLKQAGHEVEIAIAAQEDPVQVAKEYQPDILGYSVMTGSQRYYLDLNMRIREALNGHPVTSVFGGPHPTFFPEMVEERGVNGICVGEGGRPHCRSGECAGQRRAETRHPQLVVQDRRRDRAQPGAPAGTRFGGAAPARPRTDLQEA